MNSIISLQHKISIGIVTKPSFISTPIQYIFNQQKRNIVYNNNINNNRINSNKIVNDEFLSLSSQSTLNKIQKFELNKYALSSFEKRFFSTTPPTDNNNNKNNSTTTTTTTTTNKTPEEIKEDDIIVSIKPKHEQEKVGWKIKIKQGIDHYWLGTKLLGKNISIAVALIKRVIKGHTLTRRERRLLVQTSADVMRLVPFVIIVLVPFLELALPFILKLFPNLLPSTYTWENERLEGATVRSKSNSKVRGQLKDLLHEISSESKKDTKTEDFFNFMTKVKSGQTVTSDEVLKMSQYFKDDIIMEKITRSQLLMMHRYLAGSNFISKWYSNEYLKAQIYKKLDKIKQDDILIKKEGLSSLTLEELVDAAITRGFKVEGYNRKFIEGQLDQWLDLSLNKSLPPSILILSRAFTLSPGVTTNEALEDTLEHIPQDVLNEVVKDLPSDLSTEQGQEMVKEKINELTKEQQEITTHTEQDDENTKVDDKNEKQPTTQDDQQQQQQSSEQQPSSEQQETSVNEAPKDEEKPKENK
ncbi:hypothetical protein DDB_G0278471 [Dictyostelium discoideum AX4]|uniref:Letm1 RBD domain-containing protein n=1 Tax=Dictyostelium discoideum TaxID=44689 RepID=Q54Y17_DICDI|nr:hypothetical protein DDB_G0278471 [Dictyostelium discoideum AX4]EAL68408.1 hypothetical protein DDB_G0278471 [Dictyostelium discoideum AX4]|eukprot:XP_642385.1 hypothetical protein DDB_G0278471 [Dictyostelium discoideum AX4]